MALRDIQSFLRGNRIYADDVLVTSQYDDRLLINCLLENDIIFSVIDKYASVASAVPMKLERNLANGDTEIIESHPILDLFKNPNPQQSGQDLIHQMLIQKGATGNTYVLMLSPTTRNRGVRNIVTLPPQDVDIITSNSMLGGASGYRLISDPQREWRPDEVIHIKEVNPKNDFSADYLYGFPRLQTLKSQVVLSNNITNAESTFAQNKGPKGFFTSAVRTTDNSDPSAGFLSETEALELKSMYRRYLRANNPEDVPVISTPVDYKPIGASPKDMDSETKQQSFRNRAANLYRVPPILLETDASTYNNYSTALEDLYINCIMPELRQLYDGFNRDLLPRYPDSQNLVLSPDYSNIEVLQKDKNRQADTLKILVDAGIPIDEAREIVGI